MTRDSFAENVETTYRFSRDGRPPVDLRLVELRDLGAPDGYEAFALSFRGPREPILPQSIYRVAHDRAGEFDLFVVPLGCDDEGTTYEAVFNRKRAE